MGRPCIFMDRDGVINVRAPRGEYIERWEDWRLVPEAVNWIKLFNALGYLVIVVTNQRGVALGRMTAEDVECIHSEMVKLLAAHGARVDDVFYCPHEAGTCGCRKPLPGMVREAAAKWDIDLSRSALIG